MSNKNWEYKQIAFDPTGAAGANKTLLDAEGDDGYELVGYDLTTAIFKRELTPDNMAV